MTARQRTCALSAASIPIRTRAKANAAHPPSPGRAARKLSANHKDSANLDVTLEITPPPLKPCHSPTRDPVAPDTTILCTKGQRQSRLKSTAQPGRSGAQGLSARAGHSYAKQVPCMMWHTHFHLTFSDRRSFRKSLSQPRGTNPAATTTGSISRERRTANTVTVMARAHRATDP